jgi:nucleotide-binding universal stress UspA family protein
MYRRILLAYDGSVEGRRALREGARLAQICPAEVFLLAVVESSPGYAMDAATVPLMESEREEYEEILAEGARRLVALGFAPTTRLETGDPAQKIGAVAKEIGADLVVVGHRRRGALARWLIGSVGTRLIDQLECSLLVARMELSDEQFAAAMSRPGSADR